MNKSMSLNKVMRMSEVKKSTRTCEYDPRELLPGEPQTWIADLGQDESDGVD
jgi:hypothetical protein